MLYFINELFHNNVLMSGLSSWFFAQFLKILIEIFSFNIKKTPFNTKDFLKKTFFETGGMPSSHSATISAMSISIAFSNGIRSPIFALSLVLVFIVVRDATGVRLSSGRQGQLLNQIIDQFYSEKGIKKIKEVRGHTPMECFIGLIIGVLIALGVNLL